MTAQTKLTAVACMLFSIACNSGSEKLKSEKSVSEKRVEHECPKGHTDEIVPIVYGYPSEEDFKNSDSGKVVLGGCELPENPKKYWCKKHKIEF